MKNQKRRETQTIEGLLIACTWDEDGTALDMAIQTRSEEAFDIENSEFFRNLSGKYIQASGTISISKKGEKGIFIKKIAILEHDREAAIPIP